MVVAPHIKAACRRFGVRRLEVFGSAARGVDFDASRSDADFLVEFDGTRDLDPLDQFFGLSGALEGLLKRPVDLVEIGAVRNPYVLRRIAERELDSAIEWYDRERSGLGQEFKTTIKLYLDRIAQNPEMFPRVREEVRRAVVLRRFPFVIHFLVEPERVVILSVFHASRNPEHLKRRH